MSQGQIAVGQGAQPITAAEIARRVAEQTFGRPLITNVLRGHVVEAIVASALEPEWRWCSSDYASWDFDRVDGLRLEVKQSAERQSWKQTPRVREVAGFDIAGRTGRYEKDADDNDIWVGEPGRSAHVYVFAHHVVIDDTADHREPAQWRFHVVAATLLPDQKRLGIHGVRRLADAVGFDGLAERVRVVADDLAANRAVAA